jgi:hypothetical protein
VRANKSFCLTDSIYRDNKCQTPFLTATSSQQLEWPRAKQKSENPAHDRFQKRPRNSIRIAARSVKPSAVPNCGSEAAAADESTRRRGHMLELAKSPRSSE